MRLITLRLSLAAAALVASSAIAQKQVAAPAASLAMTSSTASFQVASASTRPDQADEIHGYPN